MSLDGSPRRAGHVRAAPAAFVLGLGENGYGITRSLRREGIAVVGFYSARHEYGRLSRYCEAQPLPPGLEPEQVCETLIAAARGYDKPVLFPTSDRDAVLLANWRGRLEPYFRFHWTDAGQIERIVDKARMDATCRTAQVPVPDTHMTRAGEDLAQAAAVFPFPCIVKPSQSFGSRFPSHMKNFIAGSPDALLAFYAAHPGLDGATLWQEIIEGGDDHVYQCNVIIRARGDAGAAVCVRKIHQYPPGYGVMCLGRSERNDTVAAQALRLLRFIDYRGMASLEFKYQEKSGRYYFIEMNPRMPWYNALFVAAGVNLPYLVYLDLAGGPNGGRPAPAQQDGVSWLSLKLDLGWLLAGGDRGRAQLIPWVRSAARAQAYAWFDPRDLRPFLRATAGMAATAARLPFQALAARRRRVDRAAPAASRGR